MAFLELNVELKVSVIDENFECLYLDLTTSGCELKMEKNCGVCGCGVKPHFHSFISIKISTLSQKF